MLKHNLILQVNTKHVSTDASARSAGTQDFEVNSNNRGDIKSAYTPLNEQSN